MAETTVIEKRDRSLAGWIEANNQLIYNLITGETVEVASIDVNVRLKLITQLKLRNKELRLLRVNRITDRLMDKIEVGVENLMKADYNGDLEYIPMYLQILKSLQDSAQATNSEISISDTLIFDTIEDVTHTGLSDSSRDKIRTTARELLTLCTTTSKNSENS